MYFNFYNIYKKKIPPAAGDDLISQKRFCFGHLFVLGESLDRLVRRGLQVDEDVRDALRLGVGEVAFVVGGGVEKNAVRLRDQVLRTRANTQARARKPNNGVHTCFSF